MVRLSVTFFLLIHFGWSVAHSLTCLQRRRIVGRRRTVGVFAFIQVCAAVMESQGESKTSFSKWKYAHYFPLVEHKDKNILVKCKLSFWFEGPIYCDKQQLQSVETPPETNVTCLDEARSKPGVGRHTRSESSLGLGDMAENCITISVFHIGRYR